MELTLMSPHYLMVIIQSTPKEVQVEIAEVLTVMCKFSLAAVLVPKEWEIVNVKDRTTNSEALHVY